MSQLPHYFQFKIITIFLLGISSGLPLALSGSALALMLLESGVDIAKISLFGLASTPYAFKYLWSPLVDNLRIPILSKLLGRRRSWLLLTQALLTVVILFVGLQVNISENLFFIGISILTLSFLSATQDIIIDAYRIEILSEEDQGMGVATAVLGYRVGMLLSGAGSLYLAHFFGWKIAYCTIGSLILPGLIAAFLYGEPINDQAKPVESGLINWFSHAFIKPFLEFIGRQNWILILLFIMLYKLSDAYLSMMTTPFLVEIGFSKLEIANIIKIYGFIAMSCGMFVGGYLLKSYKNSYSLLAFGLILESLSNLAFLVQSLYGHDNMILTFVISVENLCSGISTAMLVAYISNMVNKEFTATSYALLTSFVAVGRATLSSSAGSMTLLLGWTNFFIFTSLLSLPAFICLYYLYHKNKKQ